GIAFLLGDFDAGIRIIQDRGQRLVQLVRQSGGDLAHVGQPADMQHLRLRFLDPAFLLPARGNVYDDAEEDALAAHHALADRKTDGKGRTVLAPARNLAADADDVFL